MSKINYTQEEVGEIIKRAVQLEAERNISSGRELDAGLTLSEIEEIAAESGIDPELIQKAVQDLGHEEPALLETVHDAAIKKDEIVSEKWLDLPFRPGIIDDIVTELNHKYGTSDKDITWWDDLWKNYDGKAKVRKSKSSLEWQYSDELGMYTTRVLIQSRGDRLRIRVSKRQMFKMNWNQGAYDFIYPLVFIPVFSIAGGTATLKALDTIWPGASVGILLGALLYPIAKYFRENSLKKHREEVIDTADTLTDLTLQLLKNQTNDASSDPTSKKSAKDYKEIEISDDNETDLESTTLKNNLRERS